VQEHGVVQGDLAGAESVVNNFPVLLGIWWSR
jgi:hypothetical protein